MSAIVPADSRVVTLRPVPKGFDLDEVCWDSHTCSCKVQVRRYDIDWLPKRHQFDDPKRGVSCTLHYADGSVTSVPMHTTTIGDMVKSGLYPEYWLDVQRRQNRAIATLEKAIRESKESGELPTLPENIVKLFGDNRPTLNRLEVALENAKVGRTYVDDDGIRRTPGNQLRGHLVHRCNRHSNVYSMSLMTQLATYSCGCQITQVTIGERREDGTNHERIEGMCPVHLKAFKKTAVYKAMLMDLIPRPA